MQRLYVAAKQDAEQTSLALCQHSDPGIDRRNLQPYSGGLNWHAWEEPLGAQMFCSNADDWLHRGKGPQYTIAVCIVPDGNMWSATFLDFVNLQESPAGFGETIAEAVVALGADRVKSKQSAA